MSSFDPPEQPNSCSCCFGGTDNQYKQFSTNYDHHELEDTGLSASNNSSTADKCKRCNRCFTRPWVATVAVMSTLTVIGLTGVLFMAFGVKGIIQNQVSQTKFAITSVSLNPPFGTDSFTTILQGNVPYSAFP